MSLFIPYQSLPSSLSCFDKISLCLTLCPIDPDHYCIISLPMNFTFSPCQSIRVPVGSSFTLEYNGLECDVRVGRRILIVDCDTYISTPTKI